MRKTTSKGRAGRQGAAAKPQRRGSGAAANASEPDASGAKAASATGTETDATSSEIEAIPGAPSESLPAQDKTSEFGPAELTETSDAVDTAPDAVVDETPEEQKPSAIPEQATGAEAQETQDASAAEATEDDKSSNSARTDAPSSEPASEDAASPVLADTTPTGDMLSQEELSKEATPEMTAPGLADTTDFSDKTEAVDAKAESAAEAVDPAMSAASASAGLAAAASASDSVAPTERATSRPSESAASAPPPEQSSGRFFPMLLGGVAAGAIGFGAHYLLPQQGDAVDRISPLAAEIAELRATVAALPEAPDLAPLEADIAALRDQSAPTVELDAIEGELAALREMLDATGAVDLGPLQEQIAALADERDEALAAQGNDIASLHEALAASEARIAALTAEMADLRDLAERRVIEAEAAVDSARAQAGLEMLRAALETGAPYPQAVAQLNAAGVDIPPALAGPAQTGIPTLEMLQEGFPSAARAALREALQGADAETYTERLSNFFRAQVGARSTAPREGDDPDAVLSRAGATLEGGDLLATLDEIAGLPETAQIGLGDWLVAAQARVDAEAALPDFIAAITTE